jgi:ABC-type Mn2+/Zn2+ transport system ATPase subunit
VVVVARRLRAARGVTVARGVRVSAGAGEVVAVEGANGSGKSTLLAAAAGLLPSDSGSRRPASVGYAPERADVVTRLSLRSWLVGLARTAGLSRAESAWQADDLIIRLGLSAAASRPLRALSRGNMQRALVAQALIGPPKLVVLDEPSGGLDADGLERVTAEIERMAGESSVVLVARHPTARVPLPAGPTWRVADGSVSVTHRPGRPKAASLLEVETGDGRVQHVSRAALPGTLRAALDAGLDVRRVQPVAEHAERPSATEQAGRTETANSPQRAEGALRRGGGLRRVVWGAAYRARLLAVSQWFAAPALLFLVLLGVIYSSLSVPPPPPLASPAFTAVALTIVMTWLSVLAQVVDGRVVARAFGAHAGGLGRAHLAACLAAAPYGIIATIAAIVWPAVTGQPGDWASASFVGQVAALHLAAVVFGIGVGTLLVPPLVVTTGWRVCLGVAIYLALVLIPASPMHPLLRLSVGNGAGGGAALAAAGVMAGIGAALIAVTTALAGWLP